MKCEHRNCNEKATKKLSYFECESPGFGDDINVSYFFCEKHAEMWDDGTYHIIII